MGSITAEALVKAACPLLMVPLPALEMWAEATPSASPLLAAAAAAAEQQHVHHQLRTEKHIQRRSSGEQSRLSR
jgi:hypothetical protein